MSSQRSILKIIIASNFIVLVLLLFQVVLAHAQDDKVNVSIYYESMCPYSANFIVNQLVKIFQTDLANIVNLRLVPWGNARFTSNNTWICQHGEDECLLNAMEACAIYAWPNVKTHFKYVHCIENLHLMNRHTEWQSCFSATGLDPKTVQDCYDNGLANQLEKTYGDETKNLNPPHKYVPWVVVNGLPSPNFIASTCEAYKGDTIPMACRSTSNGISSLAEAASTPAVKPNDVPP